MKQMFNEMRDRLFPPASILIAQQIDTVEQEINNMSAQADEHERLARQLREGVARLRGHRPVVTMTPLREAA